LGNVDFADRSDSKDPKPRIVTLSSASLVLVRVDTDSAKREEELVEENTPAFEGMFEVRVVIVVGGVRLRVVQVVVVQQVLVVEILLVHSCVAVTVLLA